MSAPPESPDHLTNGAWLPGRGGVLVWTPGAGAPEWQDARPTRCGSLTGCRPPPTRRNAAVRPLP